jgi:hypothetical protein
MLISVSYRYDHGFGDPSRFTNQIYINWQYITIHEVGGNSSYTEKSYSRYNYIIEITK